MEAAIINRYGRDVEIKDVPMPMPGPDDVVIRVVAAAVNPVDWKIRDGMLRVCQEISVTIWRSDLGQIWPG